MNWKLNRVNVSRARKLKITQSDLRLGFFMEKKMYYTLKVSAYFTFKVGEHNFANQLIGQMNHQKLGLAEDGLSVSFLLCRRLRRDNPS